MRWMMDSFLSLVVFLPVLGMFLIFFLPSERKSWHRWTGVITTLLPFTLTLSLFCQFDSGQKNVQFQEKVEWFSIHLTKEEKWTFFYHLGLDGLSLSFLLLTTFLVWIAAIASYNVRIRTKEFYSLLLLLEVGTTGVFLARNLILFFLFFEITLVATFFLIGIWGHQKREKAAFSFLIYNGLGSVVFLFAIVCLQLLFQTVEYTELRVVLGNDWQFSSFEKQLLFASFWAIWIAFAIKLPAFPFHNWMLRVHKEAPTSVVMIHSGVLLKIGSYGMIRFGVEWFGDYTQEISTLLLTVGLINLFYGAILAYVQQELRLVLAYSSISHMGIVLLGIGAGTQTGLQGAIFQSISHGLLSALLFFLVGSLVERTNTSKLRELGGLAKSMPVFSGIFLIAGFGLLGLPGLSGFISELFALMGLFQSHPLLAAIASLGLIFAAVYTLRAVLRITFGTIRENHEKLPDLHLVESLPMVLLVVAIVWMGIAPKTLLEPLQQTLKALAFTMGG